VPGFWYALEPKQEGIYVDLLGAEGADRVLQEYGSQNARGCGPGRETYDLDNFFSYSQNISPGPAGPAEPHAGELGLGDRG
jgi:hypothetical protein